MDLEAKLSGVVDMRSDGCSEGSNLMRQSGRDQDGQIVSV
jgi:hypothetical protein